MQKWWKQVWTHLSGPVDPESEATADDVEAEADEAVNHAWFKKKKKKISSYGKAWMLTDYLMNVNPDVGTLNRWNLPVVENIPPIIPHSRTRNCHSGMCCSLTVTIRELVSYLRKMPETPWLPAAWFITRSFNKRRTATVRTLFRLYPTRSILSAALSPLTRSVTENWCVSAEIRYVFNLVGTTVMKYWYIWLSAVRMERKKACWRQPAIC